MTAPNTLTTDAELIAKLTGAYSTIFERSLAKEAAARIAELTAERDRLRAEAAASAKDAARLAAELAKAQETGHAYAIECNRLATDVQRLNRIARQL